MPCLRTVFFLALLCAVASAVNQDDKTPPQEDYDHHESHPVPFEGDKTNELVKDLLHRRQDSNVFAKMEQRKFFRPPIFHPYYYPLLHKPHLSPESPETEEVTEDPSSEETGPEDAQPYNELTDSTNGEIDPIDLTEKQEAETTTDDVELLNDVEARESYEVPCDFLNVPRYSCYTCYTYLVCKPKGGKVKSCTEPGVPYCNAGVCSATPSAECSGNSTMLL